ncbi:hypothetical protein ACRAWC_11270 [Leifsonia sp. L25]|uniref:hypothetical protein n=1 Tax=Actinomycetes TaxID=1760 RepID=UPI003D69E11B
MLSTMSALPGFGIARLRATVDGMIVKYDAWFLVLLAVLLVLAFVVTAALAIWCITNGKGAFTGSWRWNQYGLDVWVECR